MMRTYFCLPLVVFFTAAVLMGQNSKDTTPIARVKVTQAGTIILDGRMVSLDALDKPFTELAAAHGKVFYYRENP
jgi:hypothetical protein